MMDRSFQKEIGDNYAFFQTKVREWQKDHAKRFALLHQKSLADFFDSENDAIKVGINDYGEGRFSLQQVNDKVMDLGYQSNVLL